MFEVSVEDLKKVFKDFYNLTHFMIVLFDSERNTLFSYPQKMCDFCSTVRTNEKLAQKCIECDNKGFDECDKTRKPSIYKCHMSVVEAIAPIYSNEMNMGYLMFGQILQKDYVDVKKNAQEVSLEYGIKLTDEMLSKMTIADDSYIESAVNMMTMCASYLYTNEIIRNNPDILIYQLKEYIKNHLESDLSTNALCKQFYISKTKLYKISTKNFGMSISAYVRKQRIKRAKKLIRSTDDSIAKIAETVGIPDSNYFIRIFKKEENQTPLSYRKSAMKNMS